MPSTILDALNIQNKIECLHLKSSHSVGKIAMSIRFDRGFGASHNKGRKGVANSLEKSEKNSNKCHLI